MSEIKPLTLVIGFCFGVLISEYPKNKGLSQTPSFKCRRPIVFLMFIIFFLIFFISFVEALNYLDLNCGNNICEAEENDNLCPVDCFIKPKVTWDKIILADYSGEIRNSENRVDIDLLIERLKGANINTYSFLLWHNGEYDFEDFLIFLESTKNKEIDVWAYLVSPREGCANVQPYGCDFVAWAEEFARLSLEYPNLKAWAIDDFLNTASDFSKESVAEFTYGAYKINPNLAFYPVVYHRYFRDMNLLGPYFNYIDGIIFPFYDYQIIDGVPVCHDSTEKLNPQITLFKELYGYEGQSIRVDYPSNFKSDTGDYISFKTKISELENKNNFVFTTFNRVGNIYSPGYHIAQVIVGGDIIFEEDLGDRKDGFEDLTLDLINIDLSGYSEDSEIILKVFERKKVSNFLVRFNFLVPKSNWEIEKKGYFSDYIFDLNKPNLGLVVMIYGQPISGCGESTPGYVYEAVKTGLYRANEKDAEGTMIYVLDKEYLSENSKYDYVKQLYLRYSFFKNEDVNRDGNIDIKDLVAVAIVFEMSGGDFPDWCNRADVNRDGNIDIKDLVSIAINFN